MKARFLALAALVLGMVSCQQDVELATPQGGEVDFQLKVDAVELSTRAGQDGAADTQAAHDSAFGAIDYLQATDAADAYRVDWTEVDLRYTLEVYDKADSYANAVPVKDRLVKIVDKYEPVVFDLRLVPNREYHFVVFADFVNQGADSNPALDVQAELGLRHNIGANLGDITIKDDAINDERGDAYFATKDITISNSAAQDIVLKRPYGKLRVIATDLAELNLNVDPAAVKVEYTAFHANAFNAVTGEIKGEYTEKVYTNVYNEISKEDVSKHVYNGYYESLTSTNANNEVRHTHLTLFTDYILAKPEQSTLHFTMSVYDDAAMADANLIKATTFNTEIPVQRNYLTTIIGNVLTTATEVEVTIDDNFINPDKEHIVDASLEDQLAAGANKKELVIDLTADVMWETGADHGSTPLIPADAVTEKVTINGNGYKFIATGAGVGPIGLANGGKLIFNDVVVVDQTESYAEGSWEFGYLEMTGKLEFNDCVIDNTIALDGEEAVFNNCRFNDKVFKGTDGQEYAAWVSNGKAYFNNCDFYGARGVKVHEAYGSEVEEVVIDNCRFHNLTKKPGVAIGTVNAATKIAIKNSTFENCQPGDQGLYIYETDTDVTTFDFTNSNNSITAGVTESSLEKLLKSNLKEINATLEADASINVSDAYIKLGGADTERIVIDGAKVSTAAAGATAGNHKLTLSTTYWSRLNTVNPDAVIVLKNLTLTSSQTSGTWNSYDVTFNCNVELENVVVEKALALDGEDKYAKLTNVTIKESHDYYALWISAVGQTVDIENLVVESAGRGIKIDEQYVGDALGKVTLNVKDAKFTTANKAAIMVKSAAGADINLNGVDIAGVAADKVNAVWVDEDAAEYAGLVNVNGGSMVVEGLKAVEGTTEEVQQALNTAANTENATVQLPAGEYTLPTEFAAGVNIICEEGVVFKGNHSLNINGATINGGTFTADSGSVVTGTINATLRGCTFEGANALRYCYTGENCVFEDCVFDGVTYGAHFDAGDYPLTFIRCTFSGFNAFGSKIPQLTMIDCVFKATGKSGYNGANLWGNTELTGCTFDFDGTASTEWIGLNAAGSGKVISLTDCTVTNGTPFDYFANYDNGYKVTVDGIVYTFVADGVMKADEDYEISSKDGMFWFANEVNVNKNSFAGKTVKLTANIDLNNEAWTPVGQTGATTFNGIFDGQNYIISNLNVNSEAQTGAHYSSGLFGWVESHTANHGHLKNVKIEGATIVGHHNCGALVGYITQQTALVENCHVTGANVSCTYANGDADGDKAGALIGNATVATPVKNCTAANSTISAGRDAGQVIGAGKEANVTGCSATEVTVEANGTGTGNNVRNEVIGRLL